MSKIFILAALAMMLLSFGNTENMKDAGNEAEISAFSESKNKWSECWGTVCDIELNEMTSVSSIVMQVRSGKMDVFVIYCPFQDVFGFLLLGDDTSVGEMVRSSYDVTPFIELNCEGDRHVCHLREKADVFWISGRNDPESYVYILDYLREGKDLQCALYTDKSRCNFTIPASNFQEITDRYSRIRYASAEMDYEIESYWKAGYAYMILGDYKDSISRAFSCLQKLEENNPVNDANMISEFPDVGEIQTEDPTEETELTKEEDDYAIEAYYEEPEMLASYILHLTDDSFSCNNLLSSLGLVTENVTVEPDFSIDNWEYDVAVPVGTKALELKPDVYDYNADIFSISGTDLDENSEGTVKIDVTAEDGNVFTYTLHVHAKKNAEEWDDPETEMETELTISETDEQHNEEKDLEDFKNEVAWTDPTTGLHYNAYGDLLG